MVVNLTEEYRRGQGVPGGTAEAASNILQDLRVQGLLPALQELQGLGFKCTRWDLD